ncbi:MAG TPA: mannitol dehydrogenase family protein [Burkholderiaceae bacterium]
MTPAALPRLNATTAPAAPYDRTRLEHGIVHLGVGAFQRAHMAQATDAAIAADADLRWGIVGVSLRSAETHDALAPQDGLYTLAIRDADERGTPRERLQVIHCLCELLVAPDGPRAVHERIAAAATRIVSLTVTEKGYLATEHGSTLDTLARGLALRRQHGEAGVTLLSLDNLPGNGQVLRERLLAHVRGHDPALADWIESHCSFPCSMVDRIVPRTTDADRERISAHLGLVDAWPVVGEPFFDWVIEDDFAAGRPAWQHGGARFVADAKPFETLKLRMVNGSHSALAYLGAMAGWRTVDVAIAQPALRAYLDALLRDEIATTLPALPGLDIADYRIRLLQRYANPALQHRTAQIAMDGSQKLPQRLLNTVRERLAAGQPIARLGLAVAAWIHYLRGRDETGQAHEIADPLAPQLALALREAEAAPDPAAAFLAAPALAPVFGTDLAHDPRFARAVSQALGSLRAHGVQATLAAWA